ncbi:DUF7344 domain-containing protein [Archaeoglobus veneficus]|uniref:DUF7344 domain-containing protein n=1 Tax=Archaeoglobus veneficus (strain DSM 11195 / SNP6) TaxID=693661 RepID=F2KNV4_ARCVS|nr:hypothetical protein [Archaeoglobus veneficus]AEA47431.1 hypothetical protein Arcve_1428 [Archaeoglobus veneficus SNP6]
MLEQLSELISNTRRRLLLKHLVERGGESSLEDAVSYICVNEGDDECRNRKSVYISLKQTHIPKLEKARILTFDKHTNTLRLEERYMKDVKMYVEFVEGSDISWSKYYLGLAGMTTLASLYIFDLWAIIISLVFLMSSAVNIARQNRLI